MFLCKLNVPPWLSVFKICIIIMYLPYLLLTFFTPALYILNFAGFDISPKQTFTSLHLDCTMTETFYSDTLGAVVKMFRKKIACCFDFICQNVHNIILEIDQTVQIRECPHFKCFYRRKLL